MKLMSKAPHNYSFIFIPHTFLSLLESLILFYFVLLLQAVGELSRILLDVGDRKCQSAWIFDAKTMKLWRTHFPYPLSSENENRTQSSTAIVEDKWHLRTITRISKCGQDCSLLCLVFYAWVNKPILLLRTLIWTL